MLKITNLEATYNDIALALKGVSLEVPPSSIVALLGSNGAGKSTTLNTVSGIRNSLNLRVEDGTMTFDGTVLNDCQPHEVAALGLMQVPEGRRIFAELTVAENLQLGAWLDKSARRFQEKRERVFTYFPILRDRPGQLAGYLSGGEQQMLAIGRALMAAPRLVMMDEPSLGLAPLVVEEIFQIISRICRQEGVSILLVEQNADAALRIADYGYVMENGRIVMEGPSADLKENEDIREFYLGLSRVGAKKSFRDVKHYRRRKRWLS